MAPSPIATRVAPFLCALFALCLCTTVEAADELPPQIVFEPCDVYNPDADLRMWVRLVDESGVFEPKLAYRSDAAQDWQVVLLQPVEDAEEPNIYLATIPQAHLGSRLEYFVEAFDLLGNGPARFGDQALPLEVLPEPGAPACVQVPNFTPPPPPSDIDEALAAQAPPPPPPPCERDDPPVYCKAWFWTAIGGTVLAGGGALGYYLYRTLGNSAEATPPDTVSLIITAGDPSAAALRGGP